MGRPSEPARAGGLARPRGPTARLAAAVHRGLVLLEGALLVALLAALIAAVAVQVVSRYLLPVSAPWTEEAARYCFVWVSMLGAALGVRRGSHFGFDAVVRRLPAPLQRGVRAAALGVTAATAALIAVQGWRLLALGASETGPATGVPMPWVYAAIPAGGALILLHLGLGLLGAEPRAGAEALDR